MSTALDDDEPPGHDQNAVDLAKLAPSLLEEVVGVVNKKDDQINELERQLAELQAKASQQPPPPPPVQTPPPVAPAKPSETRSKAPAAPVPAKPKPAPAPSPAHPPPQSRPKLALLERAAAHPLVRKHAVLIEVLLLLAILCTILCVTTWSLNAVSFSVAWICGPTTPASKQSPVRDPDDRALQFPQDPHGHVMNAEDVFRYRIPRLEENRALHRPCQTPRNFSAATSALVDKGLSMDIQTERGLISLMSLRMSLKRLMTENDYDFICSQLLDLPLCYCMTISGPGPGTWWLDIVGRLNITCVSKSATLYSNEWDGACDKHPQPRVNLIKRFQSVCVEYEDMRGRKWMRTVHGKEAVVMQQIFEVHRGMTICDSSLERTLRVIEDEAKGATAEVPVMTTS